MPPPQTAARRPPERYGAPRPWVRPLVVVGTIALAVLGAGWLLWAAIHHSDARVSSQVSGFEVVSEREIEITVTIERDPGQAVRCVVQARASDHSVVGEREMRVAAGADTRLSRTVVVTTEREATAGVLDGCVPAS